MSSSFLVPYSHADVIKKRQTFKLRTDHSFGFMGRTMDFMNCLVTGWYLNRNLFASRGTHFAENAARYYEHVRDNDLFLTHVLVNPQIDRSRTSAEQEDPFLHLGRVRETKTALLCAAPRCSAPWPRSPRRSSPSHSAASPRATTPMD